MDGERRALVQKAAEKYRRQHDAAFRNYQDTGYRKFDNAAYRSEVLADALEGYLRMDEDLSRGRRAIAKIRTWAGMLQDFNFRPREEQERVARDILAEIRITDECI